MTPKTSTSKNPTIPKRPRTSSSNPDTSYLEYLRSPNLSKAFTQFSSKDVHQERFVNFNDFPNYDISNLFNQTGLRFIFSLDNKVACYPFLVMLFYTNLQATSPPPTRYIETIVKNITIKLTPTQLGTLLRVPTTGATLQSITIDNPAILQAMFEDGTNFQPGIFTRAFRPLPRLVGRIISHNILQKSGSFTYISNDLAKFVYAILGGIPINWSRIIYDTITKITPTSTLAHGCILTHIFRAFDVPLTSETDIHTGTVPFDRFVIKRMHLPIDPMEVDEEEEEEEEGENEDQGKGQGQGEEEEDDDDEDSSYQGNFDFDALITQVENLSTNQSKMIVTQDRLVASHYVMQHQLSRMRESQDEILRRFNEQFPPPPQ